MLLLLLLLLLLFIYLFICSFQVSDVYKEGLCGECCYQSVSQSVSSYILWKQPKSLVHFSFKSWIVLLFNHTLIHLFSQCVSQSVNQSSQSGRQVAQSASLSVNQSISLVLWCKYFLIDVYLSPNNGLVRVIHFASTFITWLDLNV